MGESPNRLSRHFKGCCRTFSEIRADIAKLTKINALKIQVSMMTKKQLTVSGEKAMNQSSDLKLHGLTMLSVRPIYRRMRQWWLRRTEEHYLICAAVEHERAQEAEQNESYYQKRAAMARSARHWD
jgi:hypothetical protein